MRVDESACAGIKATRKPGGVAAGRTPNEKPDNAVGLNASAASGAAQRVAVKVDDQARRDRRRICQIWLSNPSVKTL